MNVKCRLACLFIVGNTVTFAAPPPPAREQLTADPNDPTKTRRIVSRDEREALGLRPHTWADVVDPEVYTRLDRLKETVANLRDRLNENKNDQAFDLLHKIRFEDAVYVQVRVKGANAQRRVLASLKASEFRAPYVFDDSAGLTGYVTKEGAEKLAKHPDVLGVCLDDQPLVQRGKVVTKDDLPPETGPRTSTQPGVAEGKVDPDVYRALDLAERVYVTIHLRADSLPRLTGRAQVVQRERAIRQIQDRILSSGITADEFWVWGRSGLTSALSGHVTREGLEKLLKEADIGRIYLQQRHHTK